MNRKTNVLLSELIQLNEHFARSSRIDDNKRQAGAFVCSPTIDLFFSTLSSYQSADVPQGAYTWTGPYGSGKSTLANCLLTYLTGNDLERAEITREFSDQTRELLNEAFFKRIKVWKNISITGSKSPIEKEILKKIDQVGIAKYSTPNEIQNVIENIEKFLVNNPPETGLILVVDELGKFLEYAVAGDGDVYLYQLLAELATRSNGRFIFIGILHQSIQEYAATAIKRVKDEWSKVQGRFVDLGLNLNSSEQIALISNAINSPFAPIPFKELSATFGQYLAHANRAPSENIKNQFEKCWPLNPVVTYILGPVSRRSYGQNQRSLFSFVGSNEPLGFRSYLSNLTVEQVPSSGYNVGNLWDYLTLNWSGIITTSQDSHSFSIAKETLLQLSGSDFCNDVDLENLANLIKSVHLLELTKSETGLTATIDTLSVALGVDKYIVERFAEKLVKSRLISLRSHNGTFFLHEGSNFDIDLALSSYLERTVDLDMSVIGEEFFNSHIIAKRHYLETGTLRWADVRVVDLEVDSSAITAFTPNNGHFGRFIINIGDHDTKLDEYINRSSAQRHFAYTSLLLNQLGKDTIREFAALLNISETSSELSKDKIARREVNDRIDIRRNEITLMISELISAASWEVSVLDHTVKTNSLTQIASKMADEIFDSAPRIHNELVNRTKISGNATRATKQLLYDLLNKEGELDLGYSKFPPERAIFDTIIKANDFYGYSNGILSITHPNSIRCENAEKIKFLFKATRSYLELRRERTVTLTEIFSNIWIKPPFGLKEGVLPIFAFLFIKTHQSELVYYQDNIFSPVLTEIDVDYLVKSPKYCSLRFLDLNYKTRQVLEALGEIPSQLGAASPISFTPIDVARSLISLYDGIPAWTQKSARVSDNAKNIRSIFGRALDPAQLTLVDIPRAFGLTPDADPLSLLEMRHRLKTGLEELLDFQKLLLIELRDHLFKELGFQGGADAFSIIELNERARNLRKLAGDNRVETFISNLATLTSELTSIEKLAGMLVNKPSKLWIDNDVDKLFIEATKYAREFNTLETMSHIKGRDNARQALTIIHHNSNDGGLRKKEILLSPQELREASALSERISYMLRKELNGVSPEQLIAALTLMLESES